jgi:pyrroloquinoline quinone biosynthesis protein E
MQHIWYDSFGFNRFRGYDWMPEPCRSCDEKGLRRLSLPGLHAHRRCQQRRPGVQQVADHGIILKAREEAETPDHRTMTFRNERNSRVIARG